MSDEITVGAFTINEFVEWARVGRTKTYAEITIGALRAIKVGSRTLIPADAARDWLAARPAYEITIVRQA